MLSGLRAIPPSLFRGNTTIEATKYRGISNPEIRSPERHLADAEVNS